MAKPIKGTDGDDLTLTGTAGSDSIQGRDGNDTITGGAGNDKIDGGKGIDTAVYSGNFADYTITFKHDGHDNGQGNGGNHGVDDNGGQEFTVADSVAGRDGIDTLKNVEFLKFADAVVSTQHNTVDHFGTVDAEAQDPAHLGNMYFGDGNPASNYHIVDNAGAGIELALKEIYRQGDDIAPSGPTDNDGTAHFVVPDGTEHPDAAGHVTQTNANRSAWNFNYVVDTGLNGSTKTLSDFDFKLVVTQNGSNTHTFDLNAATHTWVDEVNPPLTGFGGDDFNHPASATVQSQVAENSVNLAFLANAFGPLATSTATGTTYDITLEALDHTTHNVLASVHDAVILNA